MNFTKTPPTKPGAYWWRAESGATKATEVFEDRDGNLIAQGFGVSDDVELLKAEWCGPLVPAERAESLISDLLYLRNEVDCRIEHGAQHGGHLDYVKLCLTQIIDAHR
jgi:hypothetical protein